MLDRLKSLGLFSLTENHYLRLEAMDLFERGLTEGCSDDLMTFVELQITQEPPRLSLLQDIAEDLHQRLLGLRESHFDVRDRVLQTLRADFQVDLSHIAPADAVDQYHLLNLDQVITYALGQNPKLNLHDQFVLRKILEASLDMAAQLNADVEMTESLFSYIMDWADGLSVAIARHYETHSWVSSPRSLIH
jgi:hypothetical protein